MEKTLYGKDTKGNVKVWTVQALGSQVIVSHGRLDGKIQHKITNCVGKNIGKANETTPEQQAVLEATSKYNKQLDKLYRPTVEELTDVGEQLPMLAHDYTKVGHRMTYPCHVSPKLDGVRCLAYIAPNLVRFVSRGGKEYPVPSHLKDQLIRLYNAVHAPMYAQAPEYDEVWVLDGELYIHGTPLQDIVSYVKKPSEKTADVKFYAFDVPSERPWSERYGELLSFAKINDNTHIHFVECLVADNEEYARQALEYYMNLGFEGIMLRNPSGPYLYNHRSSDLMKWKEFEDCEARVLDVREDKLNEGVLLCSLRDGTQFECKMRGKHEYRVYINMRKLIGKWITVRYQQLTKDGVPQFPVGITERDCKEDGTPND